MKRLLLILGLIAPLAHAANVNVQKNTSTNVVTSTVALDAASRTASGLEIGANVQAYSTLLDNVSGGIAPNLLPVDPPDEMPAFAIDVTKPVNSKTTGTGTNPTFTFSATPAEGTEVWLRITETETAVQTVTIPSSFSPAHGSNKTTFVLTADEVRWLKFVRESARWVVLGLPVLISELAETTVPAGSALLELETSGVSGKVQVSNLPSYVITKTTAASYTIGTTNANELYGGVIYVTGAATITVPAVAAGASFTVITIGAIAVSVDVNAADRTLLDGTALADGDQITNTSTTGDIAVFTYESASGWYASTNGWTDGN